MTPATLERALHAKGFDDAKVFPKAYNAFRSRTARVDEYLEIDLPTARIVMLAPPYTRCWDLADLLLAFIRGSHL